MKEPVLFKNKAEIFSRPVRESSCATERNEKKSVYQNWNEVSEPLALGSFSITARENSQLEYVLVQNLPLTVEGLARVKIIAEKNAQICFTLIQQGGSKVDFEIETECKAEGAEIHIRGLQNARQNQKLAFQAKSIHAVPHTKSDLKIWCVARDQAHSIFNGLITIKENAHHTEAYQRNKNLLLSEKAVIDTFPKLFIANDEVKCSHGSSTSTLEPDQFMYLQSRGIDRELSEKMLMSGFMNQAIAWITDEKTKQSVSQVLGIEAESWTDTEEGSGS